MISIQLKDERDAKSLYDRFVRFRGAETLIVQCTENQIVIDVRIAEVELSLISSILTEHVITVREEGLLLEEISSAFYFEDPDEQEQILSIVKSILQGEKPDLPGLNELSPRRQLVFDAFSGFITDERSFDFESFIYFRLKLYKKSLQRYVEIAIDEYKLEQDYQNFVENLRTMLEKRHPLLETIHLVFKRQFALYDQRHRRVDETAVNAQFDPALKNRWGMDMEPSVLVTLIGIAPKTLFLYTDDVDAGMIQTIQNVFQERVVICPVRACDFHP